MSRNVLAALLLASYAILAAAPSAADNRTKVAVLPVVVHASGEQDYLRSGVSDMLASRLGQSPGVAVIRITDPATATNDAAAAKEAARAVGADYVLFGSFTRFGDGASLDIRCAAAEEGDEVPRSVFIQAGQISDLIPKIDKLAEKVGVYVSSGAPAALPAVGSAPAATPNASELSILRTQLEDVMTRLAEVEAQLGSDDRASAE